jgi:hypothetical protein
MTSPSRHYKLHNTMKTASIVVLSFVLLLVLVLRFSRRSPCSLTHGPTLPVAQAAPEVGNSVAIPIHRNWPRAAPITVPSKQPLHGANITLTSSRNSTFGPDIGAFIAEPRMPVSGRRPPTVPFGPCPDTEPSTLPVYLNDTGESVDTLRRYRPRALSPAYVRTQVEHG